jgi:hypothetical protein
MKRIRKEIEWFEAEIRINYNVEERWSIEEGHGQHFVDESERTFMSAELYIGGKTIDITPQFKQIEEVL